MTPPPPTPDDAPAPPTHAAGAGDMGAHGEWNYAEDLSQGWEPPPIDPAAYGELTRYVSTHGDARRQLMPILDPDGAGNDQAPDTFFDSAVRAVVALDRAGATLPMLDVELTTEHPDGGTLLDAARRHVLCEPLLEPLFDDYAATTASGDPELEDYLDHLDECTRWFGFDQSEDGSLYVEVSDADSFTGTHIPADFVAAWAASHIV